MSFARAFSFDGWIAQEREVRTRPAKPSEKVMPGKRTIEKAREDKREGKAPTTQAGEFIREGMHKIHLGEHGARSPEQTIAVGLSEARHLRS
jgi:hypothetical protein